MFLNILLESERDQAILEGVVLSKEAIKKFSLFCKGLREGYRPHQCCGLE
jgi:hypothetical protein